MQKGHYILQSNASRYKDYQKVWTFNHQFVEKNIDKHKSVHKKTEKIYTKTYTYKRYTREDWVRKRVPEKEEVDDGSCFGSAITEDVPCFSCFIAYIICCV